MAAMDQRTSKISLAGSAIIGRNSLYNLPKLGNGVLPFDDRAWRLSYLKEQFQLKDLGPLFKTYTQKINHGYFSLFLILQFLLTITHFIIVLCLNMETNSLDVVTPDLVIYAVAGILPLIGLIISERHIGKHPRIFKYITFAAFVVLFLVDILIPIYHYLKLEREYFRPVYTTHLIIACYIFFNVSTNLMALLLGLLVTLVHVIVLIVITYSAPTVEAVGSDIIYLFCINGLGLYFRIMTEIVKMRSFLDRRACVESTLKLKYEKDQEDQLMLSIIPEHIIKKVRTDILEKIKVIERTGVIPRQKPFHEMYIETHDNVTILYADIVNYTHMTTMLSGSVKLVETLNELFGRFDDASEDLNVLRIKFLGDCYYCVAGLPPNQIPNHAEACVDLGLKMIKIIRDVRERSELEIDMRIGVHSGSIRSGIIGMSKWQFDIWSKDVYIANRMETTGQPGKVHITKQTRDQLTKDYIINASNAGFTDEQLRQYNIESFLVTPNPAEELNRLEPIITPQNNNKVEESKQFRWSADPIPQNSNGVYSPGEKRQSQQYDAGNSRRDSKYIPARGQQTGKPSISARRPSGNTAVNQIHRRRYTPGDIKRRTAFMDNNISRYQERLRVTDNCIQEAIESMPLTKYDQWVKVKDIHPFLLTFRDYGTELDFVKEPDPLFKHYIISEIIILVCVIIIQNITQQMWSAWMGYGTLAFIIFILFPLSWTHYIWHSCKYDQEKPKNIFVKLLYTCSEHIMKNVVLRIVIYLLVCILFAACIFTEMTDCKHYTFALDLDHVSGLFKLLLGIRSYRTLENEGCVIPWHMTQTCGLAIIMSFLFLRVHVWLKLLFAVVVTAIYSYFLWSFRDDFFKNSESYNHGMNASIAHIIFIVYLTVALHFIDRQSDYLHRLDYKWNKQLSNEQAEACEMRMINNILINNILPRHVAEHYLNVNREKGQLYYEPYPEDTPVAVMFASIVDFSLELEEKNFLFIMNDIISKFDQLLLLKYDKRIEKIKVANWTFMAACGLDKGRTESLPEEEEEETNAAEHVSVTLLKYAIDMMKTLKFINRESAQYSKLRIGISHGEVTAGVVGSKKPLYDIWGDAVNMASRMDSTGVPGKIQVTKNTARVIQQHGYSCQYRDHISVKGKSSKVPTYFVDMNDDDDLVIINSIC